MATTGGASTYLVTGLTANTSYFFKVLAKNEVGESDLSTGAGFKAGSVPSIPLALTLEQQSKFLIKFSWSPPADDGGVALNLYTIYWDNSSGSADLSTFTAINTKNPDTDQLLHTQSANVVTGEDYQLYVIAHNEVGASLPSGVITIKAASVPQPPTVFNTVAQ